MRKIVSILVVLIFVISGTAFAKGTNAPDDKGDCSQAGPGDKNPDSNAPDDSPGGPKDESGEGGHKGNGWGGAAPNSGDGVPDGPGR
jgi:hypothetical protein